MSYLKEDIELIQGKTYSSILRWETDPIVRKAISGFTWPSGTARITAVGHGLVNGWRAAVTGLKAMPLLNALDPNDIKDKEYHQATKIDDDIIEFNDVNASEFKPWVSGGVLQYNTPVSLANISARMSIKAVKGEYNLLRCAAIDTGIAGTTKPTGPGPDGGVLYWEETTLPATKEWIAGATYAVNDVIDTKALLFLTVGNGRIAVDNALKTITRTISASDIAALTWKNAFYDFEAFSSDATPVVALLAQGKVTVAKENTK